MDLISDVAIFLSCVATLTFFIWRSFKPNANQVQPPTPQLKLPLIGHLYLLSGYDSPPQAFSALSRKFGQVFGFQMGNTKCVVVSGQENIREVLIKNGHHFDSRPTLKRFDYLCGNKENSLAFCDWSATHKARREMIKLYTSPKTFTNKFNTLEEIVVDSTQSMIASIGRMDVTITHLALKTCANIFTSYLCSTTFDWNNKDFHKWVENCHEVFYEINEGYAVDFLPFLKPFYNGYFKRMTEIALEVKDFIEKQIVKDRLKNFEEVSEVDDYLNNLIRAVKFGNNPEYTWSAAYYALDGILGAHSAIGNLAIKIFAFLAKEPEVQKRIQNEIGEVVGKRPLRISDQQKLPYSHATVIEAIRLIVSPILPRVASRNTFIKNYQIEKNTMILLNNYDLNMSEILWDEPEKFKPERFIRDNHLTKVDSFFPFGGGRRHCVGTDLIQILSFAIVGGVLQNFTVTSSTTNYTVPIGSFAIPKNGFDLTFVNR